MSDNSEKTANSIRLVKFIAASGASSRRQAGELVKRGQIKINGQPCLDPSYQVKPDDQVSLNNRELKSEAKYYIMLNKPAGYTCSNSDPYAEKLALDLLKNDYPAKLFSAGRLDRDSEGLIIFSNDGDYVFKLTHPSHRVIKHYQVETDRDLSDEDLLAMCKGIKDDDEFIQAVEAKRLDVRLYQIKLGTGLKREVRRLIRSRGAHVLRLIRYQQGNLKLGSLPSGSHRELTHEEIRLSLSSS